MAGTFFVGKMNPLNPEANASVPENMEEDAPNLQRFSVDVIKAATNNFANANKLGEGGYGPVYKVIHLFCA